MNKLVSKNPVLKFKLGKKIVKALNGVVLNILGHKTILGPSASNFFRTIKKGYNYYNVNSGATKDFGWMHGNTGSPITFLRNVIDGNLKNPNRHSPEELRNRVYLSNTQFVTPKLSTKILNTDTPKTLIVKPKPVNNIWIKGYNRRPEITDVRAMLLKLLNLGLLQSKYGIDGKWGKDTEAAYQKYLNIKNVPSLEDTIIKANIPEPTLLPSTGLLLNEEDSLNFKKFLGGYKQGGSILKFQKGTNKKKVNLSRPKVTADWDETQQLKGAKEFVNKTIENVRKVTQPMQQHTEKASKRNKGTAALQLQLWNSGAFKGVIDKRTGKLVTYERAVDGYDGEMTRQALNNYKKRREALPLSKTKNVELKSNLKYTTILPEDRKAFGEWLYKEGLDNMIGNAFDVLSALSKNFTGLGSTINVGEGTLKLMVGYHLFDDLELVQDGDTIKHHLGKDKNSDTYRWAALNGGDQSHNNKSLIYNATMRPGQYIGGQYTMIETPNNFHISDTYNFNLSGTDYAKNKTEGSDATKYDIIRYLAGVYGANKDIPFELDIPMNKILEWYNDFKLGKSVYNRKQEKNEEYAKKGYIGTGRQVYL